MSQGNDVEGDDGPSRRQLLGLLGAGGITALSAALVVTGASLGPTQSDDNESAPDEEQPQQPSSMLSVSWDATYGGDGPSAFTTATRGGQTVMGPAPESATGDNASATAANESVSGNESTSGDESASELDGVVAAAGIQTAEDDAGEAWVVGIEGPESTVFESTYISEANRERRALDEGGQVFDAVETVVPTEQGLLLIGWTHDLSPDSKYPLVLAIAPDGGVQWQRSYSRPGVNSFRDVFYDGVQTADGGYLLAGVTLGAEFTDTRRGEGWLGKIGPEGELAWDETYTPTGDAHTDWTEDDSFDGFSTIVPIDGGYLLTGAATPNGPSDANPSDAWAVVVDADGAEQWSATYEFPAEGESDASDLSIADARATEDGYLVAGTAGNYEYVRSFRQNRLIGNGWMAALGPDGELRWQRTLANTQFRTVTSAGDAGWIVAGARDGSPWAGLLDEGELVEEMVLHETDGEVSAAVTREEGGVTLVGHRDDGETPVAFATELTTPVAVEQSTSSE
jgi:hypothetical protein